MNVVESSSGAARLGAARLPLPALLLYGMPLIPLGFMGGLVTMYLLKFSTDVLLIPPAAMGLIFGLSKIWDAISDPAAGYWSDRTNSRMGRRRPWMLAAAPLLGLSFFALWVPPRGLPIAQLTVWIGAGIVLFYTAQTALGIPHLALGAELTNDYHDRSRVFGARLLLEFVGLFFAAGAITLLEPADQPRAVAAQIAIAAALVTLGITVASVLCVRERPEYRGRGPAHPYAALRDVIGNPHARLLVAVFFLDQLGFSCMVTVVPFALQYVLRETAMSGIMIGAAIAAALVFYPVWFPLSRRFGKRNPWIAATVLKALAFAVMLFVQPGAWEIVLFAVVIVGGVQGAGGILGPSIKADVIDYDELQSGERKEGAYFAAWNLAAKAAAGVAIIFVGFALETSGFEPNVEQGGRTLLAIRLLLAGVPLVCTIAAALLLARFRLNAAEHAEIRRKLDGRSGGPLPPPLGA